MRWSMLAILFIVRLAMGYQFQSIGSVSTQLVDSFGFSYAPDALVAKGRPDPQ